MKLTEQAPTRRTVVQAAAALGLISPLFATTTPARARAGGPSAKHGNIVINRRGPVTLHSYIAPESSAIVAAHIIETGSGLYLVDTQFAQSSAAELRTYADSLGKPIRRVYLSHPHPDHFSGYEKNFSDIDFVSTMSVAAAMKKRWMDSGRIKVIRKMLGGQGPNAFVAPQAVVKAGTEDWDGVAIEIIEIADAEAVSQIAIHIPEAGTLIAQDLVYANAHAFPLGNHANWIKVLTALRARGDTGLILAGHGMPAGLGAIDNAIAYLAFQQSLLAEKGKAEEVVEALKKRYPGYGGKRLLKFVARRFKKSN